MDLFEYQGKEFFATYGMPISPGEIAFSVDEAVAAFREIPVAEYSAIAGVAEGLVRETARRIGRADSLAVFEDLGIQMNRYSTLNSYLNKLFWVLK